jgi:glutamate-1-semialdehyde 2,1-aminomutase
MQKLAPVGPVYQAGTLSGNPVAVSAGLATLKRVLQPGFFDRLGATTTALVDGLAREARAASVPFSATSLGGMFGFYFRDELPRSFAQVMQADAERFKRFFHAMLERGVYFAPSPYEAGFVSAAHGGREVEETIAAARESFSTVAA